VTGNGEWFGKNIRRCRPARLGLLPVESALTISEDSKLRGFVAAVVGLATVAKSTRENGDGDKLDDVCGSCTTKPPMMTQQLVQIPGNHRLHRSIETVPDAALVS
jgi:hypothetical protein